MKIFLNVILSLDGVGRPTVACAGLETQTGPEPPLSWISLPSLSSPTQHERENPNISLTQQLELTNPPGLYGFGTKSSY